MILDDIVADKRGRLLEHKQKISAGDMKNWQINVTENLLAFMRLWRRKAYLLLESLKRLLLAWA